MGVDGAPGPRRRLLAHRAAPTRGRADAGIGADREGVEANGDFAATYAKRAGIEGTLARGVRRCRLRRTRYIGLARTHLAHVLTALAINFLCLGEWLIDAPRAKTRRSPFARLLAASLAA